MSYKVTLIPGDGSGPEVIAAAKRVVEATGVAIEWEQARSWCSHDRKIWHSPAR